MHERHSVVQRSWYVPLAIVSSILLGVVQAYFFIAYPPTVSTGYGKSTMNLPFLVEAILSPAFRIPFLLACAIIVLLLIFLSRNRNWFPRLLISYVFMSFVGIFLLFWACLEPARIRHSRTYDKKTYEERRKGIESHIDKAIQMLKSEKPEDFANGCSILNRWANHFDARDIAIKSIPHIASHLDSEDDLESQLAAETIGRFGRHAKSALDRLVTLFISDKRLNRRGWYLDAINSIGPNKELLSKITQVMTSVTEDNLISRYLRCFDDIDYNPISAVPLVIKYLDHVSPDIRALAAGTFVDIGPCGKQATPKLIEVLKNDPYEGARINAAYAIGILNHKPELSIPALIEALSDSVLLVRIYSVIALRLFGKDASIAIPALIKLRKESSEKAQEEIDNAILVIRGSKH